VGKLALRSSARVGAENYGFPKSPEQAGILLMAKLDSTGELEEFVAVEVQTIDATGNYRNGFEALKASRSIVKTTAGLNWENVSKRILPQLVYKGQVLQREEMCKKGFFSSAPSRCTRPSPTGLGERKPCPVTLFSLRQFVHGL